MRMCAVMIDATSAVMAALNGTSSTAWSRSRGCSMSGISECESVLVSRRAAAAFLVDADPQRQLAGERLRFARQIGDLLGRFDVAREEDDAAQIELARERAHVRRQRVPLESHDGQLADMAADVAHQCLL